MSPFRTTMPSKSGNCNIKSYLSRPPQPLRVEIVQNEFFQDHHTLLKETLSKISPFKTTTCFHRVDCLKSVLTTITSCQKLKLSKISPFKISHPAQLEIIENQYFQDHYILPRWKLLKMSSFNIITPS